VADDDQILAALAEMLEEIAGVNPDDVTPDKSFVDDLDVDSLAMVEVAMAVEEKFNAKIPDDQLSELKTVGDAVNYIKEHAPSAPSA
jgi:acyl carrier protein